MFEKLVEEGEKWKRGVNICNYYKTTVGHNG